MRVNQTDTLHVVEFQVTQKEVDAIAIDLRTPGIPESIVTFATSALGIILRPECFGSKDDFDPKSDECSVCKLNTDCWNDASRSMDK